MASKVRRERFGIKTVLLSALEKLDDGEVMAQAVSAGWWSSRRRASCCGTSYGLPRLPQIHYLFSLSESETQSQTLNHLPHSSASHAVSIVFCVGECFSAVQVSVSNGVKESCDGAL